MGQGLKDDQESKSQADVDKDFSQLTSSEHLNKTGEHPQEHFDREFEKLTNHEYYNREGHPQTHDQLRQAEDQSAGAYKSDGASGASTEKELASQEATEGGSSGFYKPSTAAEAGTASKPTVKLLGKHVSRKKAIVIASAIGGFGIFLVVVFIIFQFLGAFKTVHFATVLRAAGFARFNVYMQRQYARTITDAATLTSTSKGPVSVSEKLQGRTMFEVLAGINPQKAIAELGRQGTLKFEFQGKEQFGGLRPISNFLGVEISGQQVLLDNFAMDAYSQVYNDLSKSEKAKVRANFGEAVRVGLTDQLAVESRLFRAGVYNGFRQVTGIKMVRWTDKARNYLGMTPKEARISNLKEILVTVDGPSTAQKSGIDKIQENADKAQEQAIKDVEDGVHRNPGEIRSTWGKRAAVATKLSTAALVSTLACIVHDLSNSFKDAATATSDRAARMGHDLQTQADQIKQGDTTAEAVGAEAERMTNSDRSVVYKETVGQPNDPIDVERQMSQVPDIRGPASALGDTVIYANDILTTAGLSVVGDWLGGPFEALTSLISSGTNKVADIGCSVILNEFVQYGIAGVEILFATASAGATQGVMAGVRTFLFSSTVAGLTIGAGELLGRMIDKAVKSASGQDYSGTAQDEQLYNEGAVSTNYIQQPALRASTYAAPGNAAGAREQQRLAMQEVFNENGKKPFTERYFALDNPYSLASQMAVRMPDSFGGNNASIRDSISTLASMILSPTKLFNSLGNAFASSTKLAYAAGGSLAIGHGVSDHYWTTEEMQRAYINPSPEYETEALSEYIEPRYDELYDKYEHCFTATRQTDYSTDPNCSEASLRGEEGFKYRVYQAQRFWATEMGKGIYDGTGIQ